MMLAKIMTKAAAEEAEEDAANGTRSDADNETKNETKKEEKKPFNPYELLDVPKNASTSDIKRAYRMLALKYHPDKNSDPEAVQIFIDIQKAYEVLIDPQLRKKYDQGEGVGDGDLKMKPMT